MEKVFRKGDDTYRVEVTDIGEGYSGDYDESDPNDRPLVRFYVSKWNPEIGDFEDLVDASYCTLIHAEDTDGQQALLYRLIEMIDTGQTTKRDWELASWFNHPFPPDYLEHEPWVDRHSVNCSVCWRLFDERESIGHDGEGAGEVCPDHPRCECEEGPRYRWLRCEEHGEDCPMYVCVVCGFGFEFQGERQ